MWCQIVKPTWPKPRLHSGEESAPSHYHSIYFTRCRCSTREVLLTSSDGTAVRSITAYQGKNVLHLSRV